MMIRAVVALTAFAAAASAAAWPMVTVNSNGNLVLNSPTKAGSFQLTPLTVTAAPTTAGTSSLTTVTALDADTDAFIVSIPSSPATSAGFKLPAATEGRQIRFYNSGSGKGAFTIWTSSTSVFIDGTSATTIDIASTTSYVVATATSSTNWVIQQNALNSLQNIGFTGHTDAVPTAATTLTTAQVINGHYVAVPAAAFTLTTPTAAELTAALSNSQNGDSFKFTITNNGVQVLTTSVLLTLAAGTGVTAPADGSLRVVPGQTRTFIFYRTSASAWTFYQESAWQKFPTTSLADTADAAGAAQVATSQATRIIYTYLGTAALNTITITNAYAQIGDIINVGAVTQAAPLGAVVVPPLCSVITDGQIFCTTFAAADTWTLEITVIKAGVY